MRKSTFNTVKNCSWNEQALIKTLLIKYEKVTFQIMTAITGLKKNQLMFIIFFHY